MLEEDKLDELGKYLYEIKNTSVIIKGKSLKTELTGSYSQIKRKYRQLSRLLHPDQYDQNRYYI